MGGEEGRERGRRGGQGTQAKILNVLMLIHSDALKNHLHELTQYECGEILDYPQVCYLGKRGEGVKRE